MHVKKNRFFFMFWRALSKHEEKAKVNEGSEQISFHDLFIQKTEVEEKSNMISTLKDFVQKAKSALKGKKERYSSNLKAICTLRQIENEKRFATAEEQELLAQYSGWGGVTEAFDFSKDDWKKESTELKEKLSAEEYENARATVTDAFYTDTEIAKYMWETLQRFGFHKGNLLEPSMGIGNFFSVMELKNDDVKRYGVEIDPLTGRIAKQLYPKANIQIKGLQETRFENNFFDVAIGNIPFGEFKVNDVKYNRFNLFIHDYFIVKVLDLVRPGGIIALITSKGTMDKADSSVRRLMAQKASLIGAVRLPDKAFHHSGTKVTCDILCFQKKDHATDDEPEWLETGFIDGYRVNNYFLSHMSNMLGSIEAVTRFGSDRKMYTISNKDFHPDMVKDILDSFHAILPEPVLDEDLAGKDIVPADPDAKNYTYVVQNGKVFFKENSIMRRVNGTVITMQRIIALDNIRKQVRELIALQLNDSDSLAIIQKRQQLNHSYDQFVDKYGYITSRQNKSAFREDADFPLLSALEIVNEDDHTVTKADIFSKRTVVPEKMVVHVDTAVEALNCSLNAYGKVNLDYMAKLYSKSKDHIVKELKGRIFGIPGTYDSESGDIRYQTSEEYLSGKVKDKLLVAIRASQEYPEVFTENVEALKAVQPEDIPAGDIDVQIGTTWVELADYEAFLYETLKVPEYMRFSRELQSYNNRYYRRPNYIMIEKDDSKQAFFIENKKMQAHSVMATKTFGTERMNAYEIFERALNLKDAVVKDASEDEHGNVKYVVNQKETILAKEKLRLLQEKFREWIFEDAERREKYVRYYNDTFNTIRLREYDGSYLTFPGMNPDIELKDHQKNAVARILSGKNTLLAHVVGAGKSYTMIAAIMEQRRLGLTTKPVIVVPKSLVGQMAAEFLRLYPAANILVTTEKDFSKQNRKRFVARIAMMDFDAVIMSHSQFEKIPLSPEYRKKQIKNEIFNVTTSIELASASGDNNWSVRSLERTKKSLEAKLEKLNNDSQKDTDNIYFEDLGFTAMYVDEAHSYKNLSVYTKMANVAGINTITAQKSMDMLMKCRYINEKNHGKGIVFATGTPVSNTMCELYVMQNYLQYDELERTGLNVFDAWAANFGEITTALELTVEGSGFRFKSRFNKFRNLPELMTLFRDIADIKLAKDLNLPVPALRTGKSIIVESEPDEYTKKVMDEFVERADAIHKGLVDPSKDNFLKITHEAKLLGTDARLLNQDAPMNPDGKLLKVCANVLKEYRMAEKKGIIGTQLIFSDIGTPSKEHFNVYDFIKATLIECGISENEIRYIHDAKTDDARKKLFEQMRTGTVKILIGSTDKCGTGVNVQTHLVALHHVDCPWKPSSIEQREGRGIRQGNLNPEIAVYRYVTKGTFDAYSWSLVENKQRFISQVMTSKVVARNCEDVDEATLSYAEIKAVATGNPLIKEKMELDNEVSKLKLMKASYRNDRYSLEKQFTETIPEKIKLCNKYLDNLRKDIEMRKQNTEYQEDVPVWKVLINDIPYTTSKEAKEALEPLMIESLTNPEITICEIAGFKIRRARNYISPAFTIIGHNTYEVDLLKSTSGNLSRLTTLIYETLDNKVDAYERRLEQLQADLDNAKTLYEKPFEKNEELNQKMERLTELNTILQLDKAS